MANKKILYITIIILVLVIIGGGVFFFSNNQELKEETGDNQQADDSSLIETQDEAMVYCGQADDPMCFIGRMNGCLPVTTKMMGTDGETSIEITILGVEDGKCHFQRN